MKKLSFEEMVEIEGGGCGTDIAGGVVSVIGLGVALSATGVGAPLGVALALGGLGFALYSGIKNDNCLYVPPPTNSINARNITNGNSNLKKIIGG